MTKGDGKPCEKCGTSEWYKRGSCKECVRRKNARHRVDNPNYHRKWKKKNPEYYREWQENNPDYMRLYNEKWREENPDKLRRATKRWRKNNPGYGHKRRVQKKENGGNFTADEWEMVCEYYNYRCLACGKKKSLTADHVIPVSRGGSNDISNIQPLCKRCNSSKGTRTTDYRTKPPLKRWVQNRLL